MKLSEILGKSLDIITEQPHIMVPYIALAVISLGATWANIKSIMGWGIAPLYRLGGNPLDYFSNLAFYLRGLRAVDWVAWIIVLVIMAICVALTIVMSDAQLSGRTMKLGAAFDAVGSKLPIVVIAFVIAWVLKLFGMFFFWVGLFVPSLLLIFVGQAILLDNKDLFDSFSKSYDTARANWAEILVLLFVFLVILVLVRLISVLGVIVACLLLGYSAIVFTVLYRDRSRGMPVKRKKKAQPVKRLQEEISPQ